MMIFRYAILIIFALMAAPFAVSGISAKREKWARQEAAALKRAEDERRKAEQAEAKAAEKAAEQAAKAAEQAETRAAKDAERAARQAAKAAEQAEAKAARDAERTAKQAARNAAKPEPKPESVRAEGEPVRECDIIVSIADIVEAVRKCNARIAEANAAKPVETPKPFRGQTVAFTGKLPDMTRREAIALVEKLGGRAFETMPVGTTLLVVGDKPGMNKLDKADKWIGQVKKITAARFMDMAHAA